MRTKLNRCLLQTAGIFLPGMMFAALAFAGENQQMMIDIDTEDFSIDALDISHLTPGDSETIYTDDGKTVDILRTAQGVEIFVDGEKLDMPSAHGTDHELMQDHGVGHRRVFVFKEDGHGDGSAHAEKHAEHEVIIIKEVVHSDEDE